MAREPPTSGSSAAMPQFFSIAGAGDKLSMRWPEHGAAVDISPLRPGALTRNIPRRADGNGARSTCAVDHRVADPEPRRVAAVEPHVLTRILLSLGAVFAMTTRAVAAETSLLEQAVENWLGERDHWAFTQKAVEYDNGKPRERLERYDPSKGADSRWTLLAINGKPPTPEQQAAWARKKFKKNKRRFDSPIGDYFDFNAAKVVSNTPKVVQYEVPLRRDKSWLFQTDKVQVVVSVNKETRALEHLTANVREPVKVLLGLAKITDGNLDLSFLHFDEEAAPGPGSSEPTGSARVVVSKFGERAEFTWSDFKRVTPVNDSLSLTRDE